MPCLIKELQKLNDAFANAYAELKGVSIEEKEVIHQYAKISIIGSSTRIENAQLTDVEVNWLDTILTINGKTTSFQENKSLIENKLSKDRERSIEEVAGCRAMLLLVYNEARNLLPLTERDIRALHYELLKPYSKASHYAGQYKTQPNSVIERNQITGESRVVFQTADAGPITSVAMKDLMKWYNETLPQAPWPIAAIAEFIYRFLAIHPFQDGNGRLGRGLFLLALLQTNSIMISKVAYFLAIDRYIEKHKEEYYFVLNRCSNGIFQSDPQNYKTEYFVRFMVKVLLEAIQGIQICRQKYKAEKELSESAIKVLKCFRENPETRLTTKVIIEQTGLPRRTAVYSINALLDSQLIQKYGQGAGTRYQITF